MRRLSRLTRPANLRALTLAIAFAIVGFVAQTTLQPVWNVVDTELQDFVLANRSADSYLGSLANTPADPRHFITIVAIDERTLSELGAYNGGYPRSYHAHLIEQLLTAPPRVIAFDVGFFEPTPEDAELAAALDHARSLPVATTVVLSAAGSTRTSGASPNGPFAASLDPVPMLAERAEVAMANVMPDSRGTVRSTPLLMPIDGVHRPSLGLAAVAAYLRRPNVVDGASANSLQLAGRTIPIEPDGSMRVNFFGPPSVPYAANSTFRVVSFVDVLRGRIDPAVWRGGLVFVGTLGATGLADDYWTPTSQNGRKMAGLEIHANAAATLFSSNYLHSLPAPSEFALLLAVALVMLLVASLLDAVIALAIGPAVLALLALAELGALYAFGQLMPVSVPVLIGLVVLVTVSGVRLVGEQRRVRRLDSVTGLVNRRVLLNEMRRSRGQVFTLLLLDVVRLRDINETLGHSVGDRLLQAVAQRLTRELSSPMVRVARLDGAEFAVLLHQTTAQQVTRVCDSLLATFEVPVELNGQSIALPASIGVAEAPVDGDDAETLLRHAHAAMHTAKQMRRGYAVYAAEQDNRTGERLVLVSGLPRAIAAGELRLHFQPKLDCRSEELCGVEALVRWQHPTLGLVAPDDFIPIAEQTGLIRSLTRWVLHAAVQQAQAWSRSGLALKIAVNLSAWDLQDASLSAYIQDLLERYGVSPHLLSLEITETAVLADPNRALQALNELVAYGVDASLDDFGTGYSSLTYVRQLPLRELKVDASFVRGLAEAERDRAIVCSTIDLGHRLGMRVVAEGVEDATTLRLLRELGCDEAQGFYLSRPLSADALAEWACAHMQIKSRGADAAA